jgi:hypothetical protein
MMPIQSERSERIMVSQAGADATSGRILDDASQGREMEKSVGIVVSQRQQAEAPFKQGVSAVRLADVSTNGIGPYCTRSQLRRPFHRIG